MHASDPASPRARLARLIERSEGPMLGLAGAAVALYLLGLTGLWSRLGVSAAVDILALAIDLAFVLDLLLKLFCWRQNYLRTPWFVVDLISALPILAALQAVPQGLQGLRFVRGFRLFRVLGALRVLRTLRVLRALQIGDRPVESPAFTRTLIAAVVLYTVVFLGLVLSLRAGLPPGEVLSMNGEDFPKELVFRVKDETGETRVLRLDAEDALARASDDELHLVLGSVFGMLLVLVVVRFQIPDIATGHVRALLNVALPRQVAAHFLDQSEATSYEDLYVRMPATVIFTDIRGFTSTVERLEGDLEALKQHLERAMDAIVEVHIDQDLIVDKFIGDAVMSFRGGDLVEGSPAEHAYRVVRASLESVHALEELGDPYFHQIKVGGASAPYALIGTFGTSSRLSYTVLGDRVNLAARLEAACGVFGTTTLFCDRTRALLRDRQDIAWRRLGRLQVAGKEESLEVFEALYAQPELAHWLDPFHRGIARYETGDLERAMEELRQADAQRAGGDPPSQFFLRYCADLRAKGLPEDWSPVLSLSK